jgi:hypothetical protein
MVRTAHQMLFGRSNQKGEAVGARRTRERSCSADSTADIKRQTNGKNRVVVRTVQLT